jgi:tetratricopeptide (TPR) repeat protein/predicted amidohydrolase
LPKKIKNKLKTIKKRTNSKKNGKIAKLIADGKINKALKIANSNDIKFLFEYGTSYAQIKNHKIAEKIFYKITQINPCFIEGWYNRGVVLEKLGRYDEAVKCYDEAIRINPNFAKAWLNKGVALGKLGKYNEEVECYDGIIKINPDYDEAWTNKGIALLSLGRYDEAIKCCDEAIKINPNFAKAWYNKGIALGKLGRYGEAVKCCDEAIRINPDNDEVLANKGAALLSLGRYGETVKCCDEAIKINPKNVEAWSNKGSALENLGRYDEAVKCYDEAIRINPNFVLAWYNKGVTFGSLGRYDEAIKCCDEAIKINPNFAEAWYNKGIALGKLGRYDEAVKCYDEYIRINPTDAEAYGNKGIALLNIRKYYEAKKSLRIAKKIFSETGMNNYADTVHKYELLAINASDLISALKPLDTHFIKCLSSHSFVDLKGKSSEICNNIEVVIKEFEKRELPKDTKELLNSKITCFATLSDAIRFKKVNLKKLREAKDVFIKWDIEAFVIAVNALDTFIRLLSKYKSLNEIPKEKEEFLLRVLSPSYILDGNLTHEIFKGSTFPARPIDKGKEPNIKDISIKNIEKDFIRVCLVQLDFRLTEKFPYQLEHKEEVRKKILKALEIAHSNDVNILCFPELSFSKEIVDEAKKYGDMIIIGGSYYADNFNICPIIIKGEENRVYKLNPSPSFECEISSGKGMRSGDVINIFGTEDGKFRFVVLICIDYLMEGHRLFQYESKGVKGINVIFNPSFNQDTKRFQKTADVDCLNHKVDVIQINAKKFGGTCIIGVEHKKVIERLINEGYRINDTIDYKLCEAKEEMMLIADLSLKTKRVEVPQVVDAKPRIKIIERYIYENTKNEWRRCQSNEMLFINNGASVRKDDRYHHLGEI